MCMEGPVERRAEPSQQMEDDIVSAVENKRLTEPEWFADTHEVVFSQSSEEQISDEIDNPPRFDLIFD